MLFGSRWHAWSLKSLGVGIVEIEEKGEPEDGGVDRATEER